MPSKAIAVSLIGVPASGKTTLAQKIVRWSESGQLEVSVVVFSFDDYIQEFGEGDYKKLREDLLLQIENFMKEVASGMKLEDVVEAHELKVQEHNRSLRDCQTTLIILDDNMYFRSMRQRIRAICKTLCCDHFQIFMKSTLEEALKLNKQRATPVPDEVIANMFAKLEVPINPRTIHVDKVLPEETLLNLIIDRIANPENLEVQPESREIQMQSLIHEADILTRKELGNKIKLLQANSDYFRSTCSQLNQKRKQFMDDLRAQKINYSDVESLRAAFHCFLDK